MPVKINFKQFAKNRRPIEVNGKTVRDCLNDLIRKYPESNKWLFDKKGTLQIMVLLNDEDVYQKDLDRPVKDGDELQLTLIIGGG